MIFLKFLNYFTYYY